MACNTSKRRISPEDSGKEFSLPAQTCGTFDIMLTDPKLCSQVDALWDKFWTGGLSNLLDGIEQVSYLLFLKRLDDRKGRQNGVR